MLIAFIGGNVRILSTIARVSGGIYEPFAEVNKKWKGRVISSDEERKFSQQYLTPLLLCGKPQETDFERWVIKSISNDQTAFTGFTSLVDIVDGDKLGYAGNIRLLPLATFVEPFVARNVNSQIEQRLGDLRNELRQLDSTKISEITEIITEAERIAPVDPRRKKGKSPLFFYSVSDKSFALPKKLYQRLEQATSLVYDGLAEVASRFAQFSCLDEAIFSKTIPFSRQAFTGSIDFMIVDEDIYVIDIGAPAIGYIADIVFASEALRRQPQIGFDTLAKAAGQRIVAYKGKANELGFFAFELSTLVGELRKRGTEVTLEAGDSEISKYGKIYPQPNFDYLSRNQPLRNRILGAMSRKLKEINVKIPESLVALPERDSISNFYERTRQVQNYGLIVKKKILFREYSVGSSYFKPLITPLWGREFKKDRSTSTLFEQWLLPVEIAGDRSGLRSYEIRMYFCVGE